MSNVSIVILHFSYLLVNTFIIYKFKIKTEPSNHLNTLIFTTQVISCATALFRLKF